MASVKVVQLDVGGVDSNFSYLAVSGDGSTIVVDPCGDFSKIRAALKAEGPSFRPEAILLTHGHHDHFDALGELRKIFPAPLVGHRLCKVPCDIAFDGDANFTFGSIAVKALHTPGHTPDSVCYILPDASAIFTGDTLFIDCCGYCEAPAMFKTMREKLFPLPDSLIVYSGHNYGHVPFESLGEQKKRNPYLYIDDFAAFKRELEKL